MLTDEQLEIAAKHYCRSLGIEPLEAEQDATNTSMTYITVERWRNVAVKIKQFESMQESIEVAKLGPN